MGLEITRNQDGSPRSKWWYGNFTVGGERKYVNLGIEICGRVPASLKERRTWEFVPPVKLGFGA